MPAKKYAEASAYEAKLHKVMARLGIDADKFDWNYDRYGGWVTFFYKGQMYRFEQTIENAKAHKQDIAFGSDAFAQLVLALEDLARLVDRGIYDLQTWVSGMKALPEASAHIPEFFRVLGFDTVPVSVEEIQRAYRAKARVVHPDAGGSPEDFNALQNAYEAALKYVGAK